MVIEGLEKLSYRLRPSEGWLVFLLLAGIVAVFAAAVNEVGWVPEDAVVNPTAVFGFLLGVVLAKRPLRTSFAWTLLTIYCLLITTLFLAQLFPPFTILGEGWEPTRQFWLQNGSLFLDRMAGWFLAVFSGGSSRETIVFAFALGTFTFFLAAFAGWTTFRQQRPLHGLMLMGLALAINSYFGTVEIWWMGFFVGMAALLTAVVNYARLEKEWNEHQVDYPEDTRLELAAYSAFIAAALLVFALTLPGFSITRVQEWFASLTPVAEAESSLGQAFAGVDVPRENLPEPRAASVRGGIMPRDYLLQGTPELFATVMMTAVVSVEIEGEEISATPEMLQGTHWRALSYDIYTGRGWAISEERLDPTDAFEIIPSTGGASQTTLTEQVHWQRDNRVIRYSIGLPVRLDQPTTVSWRGVTDLARVRGVGNIYEVTSRLSTATPAELRQTNVTDVPPALLARYTQLPDSIPDRVLDLAQEVAGEIDNPYDQARALEIFLRQYPYSLELPLPPRDVDPVDFFLFNLQTGYCDYYASSMVILARSLGLPARMAVGFLGQPPDENGVQTVRQENGHSWVEIYFAGYGWVEFEPTAAFVSPQENGPVFMDPENRQEINEDIPFERLPPPPIPDQVSSRPFPWNRLAVIGLILLGFLLFWRRGRADRALRADRVIWAYGRLQKNAAKIGYPPRQSQTPAEFSASLLSQVDEYAEGQRLYKTTSTMPEAIQKITHLYSQRRYGRLDYGGQEEARRAWGKLQRPFWWLRLARLFSRK